jgi:hypothetical protein
MKIKRFNESLNKKYNPTDKILKVTFSGSLEVPLKKIEDTEYFGRYYKGDNRSECIAYGIEEWLKESGEGANHYQYEICDGNGNPIENEEEFDKQVERMKKYNI